MLRAAKYFAVIGAVLSIALFLNAGLPVIETGNWGDARPMNVARSGATPVLLPGGRVMMIGGSDASGNPVASTEFFNTDGTFTPGPDMNTPRARHAATWLANGEVLVTGGTTTGGGETNSAETYDPLTNAWTTLTNTLGSARSGHVEAQLPDGNVLIVGGENGGVPISSVEIFTLIGEEFKFVGSLATARRDAAAAVMPDGRALIAGGTGVIDGNDVVLNSTEMFTYNSDLVAGVITPGPNMTTARTGATATATYDGVAVIGGNDGTNDLGTAEIFSQWTNSFRTIAGATPRSKGLAILLPNNGSILVTGGTAGKSVDLLQSWRNDKAGLFLATAPSNFDHTAGSLVPLGFGGLMLASGGNGENGNTAELYHFPTIATDKSDYAPGTTVMMTGSGFQPGETVNIHLHEWVNQTLTDYPDFVVTADDGGSFTFSGYAPTAADLNSRYHLTAIGQASGYQAQTIFTDAPSFTVAPGSGQVGTSVSVTSGGGAFGASTNVGIYWDSVLSKNLVPGCHTNNGGNIQGSCTFLVPSDSLPGLHTVIGTDGKNTFTGTFEVLSSVAATTTSLNSSSTSTTYGGLVTFTASVTRTSGSNTPSGSVDIKEGTTKLCTTGALTGTTGATATASCSVSTLSAVASPHSIIATYAGDANFTGSSSPAIPLTVDKKALTVSGISAASKIYDGNTTATLNTENAALVGVLGGDSVILNTGGASAIFADKNVGTAKSVTVSGLSLMGTSAGNYTLTQPTGFTADITAKHITGSFSTNAVREYDGTSAAAVLTRSLVGAIGGDSVSLAGGTATFSDKDVGTAKTVTLTGASLTGTDAGNYVLDSVATTTADISAREITVTADAKTKVYGDADPALSYQITLGSLVTGDAFTGSLVRDAGENVVGGPYAINQGTLTAGTNYAITYVPANLTITARPITVTADAQSKVYGDADPALTYQVTSGSLVFNDAFTGALTRVAGENVVGSPYAIQQGNLALSANYVLTYSGAHLTITPRPITVTADAKTRLYGEPDPPLTYSITTGSVIPGDLLTGALKRAEGVNVGTYALTRGDLDNPNYKLTFVGADFTINPRRVTVTADAKSKIYGEVDPALTYQVTGDGLASGEGFTGALTRTGDENVGSHPITQGTLALSANYILTYVGANLSIEKRSITVTADQKTKTYGDTDPALSYQITSGSLAFSDAFAGALTRVAGENVGPYAVQQATLALSANYTLTYVGANLTITARPIAVTADAQTKVYGHADPTLTYQITSGNVVAGDSFSGSLTRVAGENVGAYAIQQGSMTLGTNYELTYSGANLTITARPIAVTADAQTKVYGHADPTLTYQITSGNVVAGDSFSGSLTRVAGENVGAYAIQQGSLTLGTNYELTYSGANLTITARPITVTADAQTKVYGDADPALNYKVTTGTLVGGDVFTGALTRVVGENVGAYAIQQGTLALSTNYTLTFVGANLTITARPITVTADPKTKILGASDPALSYQVTSGNLVSGDSFSGSLTRVGGENIGTYAIQQGTLTAGTNYNVSYVGANLRIMYASAGMCYGDVGHTILQPINANGSSVFKQKSTVPAKFRVCDVNGHSIGTAGVVSTFYLIKTSLGTAADLDEAVDSTTPDVAFRWSASDQQWIFNISTKGLSPNVTYTYRITLNDGSTIEFLYGLK